MSKPVVLSMLGAFWPGNDASGPNQSYMAMARALAGEFDFRLLARDRPFGAGSPAADSGSGWIDHRDWQARYLPVGRIAASGLREVLRSTSHDVVWLNGFFDREFTIPALLLRRFGRVPRRPAILSPRGEFAAGALGLKAPQKRTYLRLCRTLGLLDGVTLHATSDDEAKVFRAALPWAGEIAVAGNVRLLVDSVPQVAPVVASPVASPEEGVLRIAFVGRIARVKNLDYALRVLAMVGSRVQFDIYGPVQEAVYWQECQALIRQLPANVTVVHRGEIANDAIPRALSGADVMFLPTMGENFGHAIFEALSCGVPVLISDTTPWRNLARDRAGWDLPLADPGGFARAIGELAAMDRGQRAELMQGARKCAERWVGRSGAIAATRSLISRAMARPAARRDLHNAGGLP